MNNPNIKQSFASLEAEAKIFRLLDFGLDAAATIGAIGLLLDPNPANKIIFFGFLASSLAIRTAPNANKSLSKIIK